MAYTFVFIYNIIYSYGIHVCDAMSTVGIENLSSSLYYFILISLYCCSSGIIDCWVCREGKKIVYSKLGFVEKKSVCAVASGLFHLQGGH